MDQGSVQNIAQLEEEIQDLNAKLLSLRSSRRLLMNLLTAETREKQMCIQRLELENRRLRLQLKRRV